MHDLGLPSTTNVQENKEHHSRHWTDCSWWRPTWEVSWSPQSFLEIRAAALAAQLRLLGRRTAVPLTDQERDDLVLDAAWTEQNRTEQNRTEQRPGFEETIEVPISVAFRVCHGRLRVRKANPTSRVRFGFKKVGNLIHSIVRPGRSVRVTAKAVGRSEPYCHATVEGSPSW